MEARIGRSMPVPEHPSTPAVTAPMPAPVPPPSTRRPRVREVSSRFMSPVSSSSSSSSSSSAGDLHLLTTNSPRHQHHNHQHQNHRSISAQRLRRQLKMADGDENRPSETARSLDSPFPLQQDGGKTQQQNRSKPLKENGNRLDTPTSMLPPPSRSRLNHQRLLTASAATRLLRLSVSSDGEEDNNNREKSNGSDLLPTSISIRNNANLFKNPNASPLNRSLSSSSCDDASLFREVRASLSLRNGIGLSLPPVAPNSKIQADTKKQKKVLGQQADVQSLKLLHNRYLQWRFANANAEVKTQSQKAQAERMIHSLGLKISELSTSVQKKRIELQSLLRLKAVTEIVESQIPSLEQWSVLEEDYSTSLLETTEALSNASLRLPLDVNIKIETKQLAEALTVASKSMEGIMLNIGNFVPKTQKMDTLMSELANVTSREKASIEDCGVALLKTHSLHIEECYLRSQLIQHQKKYNLQECT